MERGLPRVRTPAAVAVATVVALAVAAASARTAAVPKPRSDLAASVLGAPERALVATTYTFRIVVSNRGPQPAARAVLTGTLAGEATVVGRPTAGRGACTVRGAAIRCTLGRLRARQRATIAVNVRASALGEVSGVFAVASASRDRVRRNNRAELSTRIVDFSTVQGRGVRSTMGDNGRPTVTTEIDARKDPLGAGEVRGTFAVRYDATSSTPARGSDLRGRVVCLTVEGNRAMAGGVVESSNSQVAPAGSAVRLSFTDNGDPGVSRDRQVAFLGGEPTCSLDDGSFELPLIEGNFVVRDGEP